MRTAHGVRLASILAVGAFALHQLRYLLASGDPSAVEGHRYMADLLPPLSVLVLAALLATLLRGTEGASPARAPLARRVVLFSGALLVIYAGQELLEGLMAAGHSANLAALLAGGGWIALPLAVAIGGSAALVARLLEGVEGVIAVVHGERSLCSRAPAIRGSALRARVISLLRTPLAFGLARRPPPPVAA
jgi:hypothetical protein